MLKLGAKENTSTSVKRFFFNDRYYPTIRRRAGQWALKSSVKDDVGGSSGTSVENQTETEFLRISHYRKALRSVQYAIDGCSDRSQKILKYEYQQRLQIQQVRELIGLYGHDTFRKADQHACYEFVQTIGTARVLFEVTDIVPMLICDQDTNRS